MCSAYIESRDSLSPEESEAILLFSRHCVEFIEQCIRFHILEVTPRDNQSFESNKTVISSNPPTSEIPFSETSVEHSVPSASLIESHDISKLQDHSESQDTDNSLDAHNVSHELNPCSSHGPQSSTPQKSYDSQNISPKMSENSVLPLVKSIHFDDIETDISSITFRSREFRSIKLLLSAVAGLRTHFSDNDLQFLMSTSSDETPSVQTGDSSLDDAETSQALCRWRQLMLVVEAKRSLKSRVQRSVV